MATATKIPTKSPLRTAREAAGLSRSELARAIGCHLNTIFLIEERRQEPSLDLAKRLANALNSTIEQLFP